jgi:hypothetical protein
MIFPYLFSKVQSELYLLSYEVFYLLQASFAGRPVMPPTGIIKGDGDIYLKRLQQKKQ